MLKKDRIVVLAGGPEEALIEDEARAERDNLIRLADPPAQQREPAVDHVLGRALSKGIAVTAHSDALHRRTGSCKLNGSGLMPRIHRSAS